MSSNDFLQALSEDRSKDAEVLKKPQYAGIMNMVTELYPDNAHFIYELLQNAEDTEATTITFSLTSEKLVAEHNGIRLFTEKDVESITSIGNSTKRDDVTSIGKFGVGFKAVFSYTNTPTVYSGDFAFKIRDLVVPEIIAPLDERTDTTIFEFPFNNSKKPALLATQEVEKGFVGFGDNTLLFLSHIRKINYSLPDGSQGSLERIDHENGRIEIRAKHPHSEETISHWLHFHKDVEVTDADSNLKNCRVAMAYQLEKITEKNKDSETWKIIPVHGGGQVSIYFPAEKETSKLRFHIHAPFASTVARDSVRDCDDNQQLRDHLAELIVESFTAIRDQEMLIMSFLAVLPTPKDELAEFYEPIRKKIVHAFQYSQLTPTKFSKHFLGRFLYRGSSKISDVISDSDLKLLINGEYAKYADWAANAPQRNSREDNFIESLDIKKWEFEELLAVFHPLPYSAEIYEGDDQKWSDANAIREKTIKSWFEQKEDKWFMRFYALLNDVPNKSGWASLNFRIVRVEENGEIKHVKANNAYFAPLHENISTEGVNIVKSKCFSKEVFTNKDGHKKEIDKNAEEFLEKIGVKPFDEKAVIELRLQFYQKTPPKQISDKYYDDIKRFVSYWKENAKEGSHYQRQTDELFKPVKFLLGVSNSSNYWKNATEICLDSPIAETGLGELVGIHGKFPIYSEYVKNLNEDELKDFVEFLKAMGVMHTLKIVTMSESQARYNKKNPHGTFKLTSNSISRDYEFDGYARQLFFTAIRYKNSLVSKLVWNVIINAPDYVAKAHFRLNSNHPIKEVESSLIQELKSYAWIPTKSGEFLTPQAMTRDDLRDDFPFNNSNGLLTAIEFGKDSVVRAEEERKQKEQQNSNFKQRDIFAKESGFESLDEMEDFAALAKELKAQGKTAAEIRDILNPKKPYFEDDYSSNPERRTGKIQETTVDAPEKRTEMRERSVAVDNTETKKAAKSYLRDRYTDDDKILYCQICKKEMPFKLSDGSYYFEVVQLIGDTQKRYKENHIALCPTDAAKFQYANPSKDNISDLVNALLDDRSPDDINDSDEAENCFDIVLAGNTETVQFRRVHLIDLKAVLS